MNLFIYFLQTLVKSAVTGLAVGISLAFPILVFTTFNVVIGFLATVCIGLIATVVVGIIPLAGWKLGVSVYLYSYLHVFENRKF